MTKGRIVNWPIMVLLTTLLLCGSMILLIGVFFLIGIDENV